MGGNNVDRIESERQTRQYIKMTETPVPRLITRLGIPTIISTVSYTHLDVYKRQMPPYALRKPDLTA